MGVNPGFGGQSFIPSALDKIQALRRKIDDSGRSIDLEVDGGLNAETAPTAIPAGAAVLRPGSATSKIRPPAYTGHTRHRPGSAWRPTAAPTRHPTRRQSGPRPHLHAPPQTPA